MPRLLPAFLFLAALGFGLGAVWIPAKAELAQLLLQRAWAQTLGGEQNVKPWPWADTWPLGRLRMEEHGVDLIVLAGASGRTLAFGPGHLDGTSVPGELGNVVLSGHRDTHFRFLEKVLPGEHLALEAPDGTSRTYRVMARDIVNEDAAYVLEDSGRAELTLVTCYPFDAIVPGGPLRYVVRAELVPSMMPPFVALHCRRRLEVSGGEESRSRPDTLRCDLGGGAGSFGARSRRATGPQL